ncbi:antitoxin [Mycolicibacterium thermoresistibile]
MGFLDKVKDWVGKNPDKANTAIDKAGDFFDQRTQGKYAEHVDKAQDAARKYVGGDQAQQGDPTPPQPKQGDQGNPAPPQQP